MRCHVCNAEVGDSQRFCHECGESLEGVTDPTEAVDMQAVFDAAAGGSVTEALTWSDAPTEADPAAVALSEQDEDGVASDPTESASDDDGGPATMAVGLGVAGGVADLWGAPTADQPPVTAASDDAVAPAPTPPPDPEATTALAQQAPPPPDPGATTTMGAVPPVGEQATDQFGAVAVGSDTDQYPPVFDAAADFDQYPPVAEPFRFRLTLVLGLLAVLTAVLCAFADVTDVRTDRVVPGIENRLRTLDDIGSNLSIAAFIGAGFVLIGGLLHCFNQRWAAGLAGGSGLALAGWAAVTVGLAEVPIATAQRITADPTTPGPFLLTITRDLGYWLVVALGVLGVLAFVLSLVSAGTGGRPGLDPWSAAVGALGGVIAAAGPLVPVANATFSSNFGVNELPMAFFAGRLAQVALLGLSVMVGFLLVRTWGLGLAAGGLTVPTFLWLTTLVGVGDAPIGIGVGNLGTSDITPHAVTTVGMVVALLMLVVASTIAAVQRSGSE